MDRVREPSKRKQNQGRGHSRSPSLNSEEERRRQRRHTERSNREDGPSRRVRDDRGGRGDTVQGSEKSDSRWRSRSPQEDSRRRRHEDRGSKYSSREERSPKRRSSINRDLKSPQRDGGSTLKRNGPLPSQEASFSMEKGTSTALVTHDGEPPAEKLKPNFEPTGLLAAASNSVVQADGTSIALKYHEPSEARKPPSKDQWKLFVFKGADIVQTIELSTRSCWLVGRDLAVVDLPAEHPSVSKQHAVIQFRWIEKRNEFGDKLGRVRPYLIDLDSANGTKLNKDAIPGSRYLELRDKDLIQFGDSTREYVLMLPPKD